MGASFDANSSPTPSALRLGFLFDHKKKRPGKSGPNRAIACRAIESDNRLRAFSRHLRLDQQPAFAQALGASATGQLSGYIHFGMPMFASPTITTYNPSASNAQIRCVSVGADCSASSVWSSSDVNGFVLSCTTAPGSSAGSQNVIHWAASAELT